MNKLYDNDNDNDQINIPNRNQILYAIETYQITILVCSPGSDLLQHIPQYLHHVGWTKNNRLIGITYPRPITVTSTAQQVANVMNVPLGNLIGYAIRFHDKFDPNLTRIKYVTDTLLFREIMIDPLLSRYNVIMINETHQRSLYSDLLLGLLKLILLHRKDLRLIVSSDPTNANFFLSYFTQQLPTFTATIVNIDIKLFSTDIHYLKQPCHNYVVQAVSTVLSIHDLEPPGDILVFLTGREEIDLAIDQLQNHNHTAITSTSSSLSLLILPLYAGLNQIEQQDIFSPTPYNKRKVVISTNIAETSLIVPNITYVIDCGFVKVRQYHPNSDHSTLVIVPISQAIANQRAELAGRHRSGKVYRLYPYIKLKTMNKYSDPEILRSNLLAPLLQLQSMGIRHIGAFPFPTLPLPNQFILSLEFLMLVGALTQTGTITELGHRIAELPLDPLLAIALLKSHTFGCLPEMLAIVSVLSVDNIFTSVKGYDPTNFKQVDFSVEEGDHLTYLNVYMAYEQANKQSAWCHKHKVNYAPINQATKIRSQLIKYFTKYNISIANNYNSDSETIRKCLVSAFFTQAAVSQPDGSYRLLKDNSQVWIHPMSALFERAPSYVIYNSIIETNRIYIRDVTVVDPKWLMEAAPSYYNYESIRR